MTDRRRRRKAANPERTAAEILQAQKDIGDMMDGFEHIRFAFACIGDGHDGHITSAVSNALNATELAKMTAGMMAYAAQQGEEYVSEFMDAFDERMARQANGGVIVSKMHKYTTRGGSRM